MVSAPVLAPRIRWWRCGSCDTVDRTQRPDVHTQFHNCPGLNGLNVPMTEVSGPDVKPDSHHVPVEREDYMGKENAGRIMSIRTVRGDGSNDCTVYAPTASISADGLR